ncbi:hypothetical protein SmJEL517_g05686 [Synchytrium microbalum]|uniref:Acyl-CoA dehydrogenase n=1 Tax=Synchytrium microbalum TaxID=1806994 RepID=A0A507BU57_9FUNG|nr:uncharacterized protein SmJEL517_g05686 [Synchytrium microbalum]TPX30838.1 hypothetical protein SmJEL517_g05686 [Synchytrium microbalum]
MATAQHISPVAAHQRPGAVMHDSGVMLSAKAVNILAKVQAFVENECIPAQPIYADQLNAMTDRWAATPPIVDVLRARARELGLWNMFLTEEYGDLGQGLSVMEYSVAPDTGNMELIAKYGTPEQKAKWLKPLMEAQIRSAFTMTEPDVASSDATNLAFKMTKTLDGKHYVLNGRKHWISGSSDPHCKLYIVVGKTDDMGGRHTSHSIVLVPKYPNNDGKVIKGLTTVRHLSVFGYDDAPHGHDELIFDNVMVPVENLVLGEGRGFEVLQGRLGGGPSLPTVNSSMRTLGVGERAMELAILECTNPQKKPFGKLKGEQGKIQWDLSEARIDLEMCKRLVYHAAAAMDAKGPKAAAREIAMAKIKVPRLVLGLIDSAIQIHGGLGISQSTELASMYAHCRTLRFADGPDEAHSQQVARNELAKADKLRIKYEMYRQKTAEYRAKYLAKM